MNFLSFAESMGLLIPDLRDDGKIHRCPTADKPKSDNGAYMLNGRRGWCMDWRQSERIHWWNDDNANPFTEAEKAAWRKRQQQTYADRARRAEKAAQRAAKMLSEAELVVPVQGRPWRPGRPAVEEVLTHAYLVRKGFPLEPGLVLDGELLVPMYLVGQYQRPVGLQRIQPNGEKKFLAGTRAKGAVHRLGSGRSREVWLCEGYATALSVREALRTQFRQADVIACFSSGNLSYVASLGHGTHIMADHDESGAGEEAAIKTGLPYVMPARLNFDANDVHVYEGLAALCSLVRRRAT
jgi:putative DNA primase/helicase